MHKLPPISKEPQRKLEAAIVDPEKSWLLQWKRAAEFDLEIREWLFNTVHADYDVYSTLGGI